MGIEWLGGKFGNWIDNLIEKRMHLAGQAMVKVAVALAPEDTGLLKRSIYYTVSGSKSQRVLTLHADTHYAVYQEYGTYKMRPHPFLRPALAIAGPSFLTGVATQVQAGSSLPTDYVPRTIKPNIRPHIAAANKKYNKGIVKRTTATSIHMDRNNGPIRRFGRIVRSQTSSLHTRRKSWN